MKNNQKINRSSEKIILTTGLFDPLTTEDVDFLKKCKSKGDWLIVGLNSDLLAVANRGGFMQQWTDRKKILQELKCVDEIFSFDDYDGTSCNLIKLVKKCYIGSKITFVSEDDMHNKPETKISGITFETIK